jgi:hypothetical protein
VFSFSIAFLAVIINFGRFVYANSIDILNIVSTILFLAAWVKYGFYWGCKKDRNFMWITLVYWGINVAAVIIRQLFDNILIYMFTMYVSIIPMYGLYYFMQNLYIDHFTLDNLLILSIVVFSTLGYIIGWIYPKRINNSAS